MFINSVILVGQQYVMKEEKHIVELLIILLLKSYKEANMI
jgi:hypothetical protein